MNSSLKRSRQPSVLEFFSKKQKNGAKHFEERYTIVMNTLDEKDGQIRASTSSAEKTLISAKETSILDSATEDDNTEEFPNSEEFESLFNNSEDLFNNCSDEWFSSVKSSPEKSIPSKPLVKCTENKVLPALKANETHSIMFRPHLLDGIAPRPYPDDYRDKWDENHVRMPCSSFNRCPVESSAGTTIGSRWEVICNSLNQKLNSSFDLMNAILQYNMPFVGKWDFRGLHSFINTHLEPSHREVFFNSLLPGIADLALQLPHVCTRPIPLLKKHSDHILTLSQKQIACLLANAFFCTFPRRNPFSRSRPHLSEYVSYPYINFNRLFIGTRNGIPSRNCEKLKCLLNYFERVLNKEPTGTVSFHRRYTSRFPDWVNSAKMSNEMVILSSGFIESDGQGMLQVDFANKFVGGGVLSTGCVQEEIRFIICPELIISRLFTECLDESEALLITGVEQYCKYSGYADSFHFDADFMDCTPRDSWGRRQTQVVAIDALPFKKTIDQFQLSLVQRELNKAYIGFLDPSGDADNLCAVATGNWGCGAYRGSPYLKFLIQVMAASQCNRSIVYFTFGNEKLRRDLGHMEQFIAKQKLSVGDMWSLIEMYCKSSMDVPEDQRPSLFDFIYSTYHQNFDSDGDSNTPT